MHFIHGCYKWVYIALAMTARFYLQLFALFFPHSIFNALLRPAKVYSLRFCKRRLKITQIAKLIGAATGLLGIHFSGVTSWYFIDASMRVCVLRYGWMHYPGGRPCLSFDLQETFWENLYKKHQNFIDIEVWIDLYTIINNKDICFTMGHECWSKRITFYKPKFWNIVYSFTV